MNTASISMAVSSTSIPLISERIADALKHFPHWVIWKSGATKPNGKFDKIPLCPKTLRPANANASQNHLTFEQARRAHRKGRCDGVGLALTGAPVLEDESGTPMYLIALDLDNWTDKVPEAKLLRESLGGIYGEVSPSCEGFRMLALSKTPFRGGNAGAGREMYSAGRFVTVTGLGGKGAVLDATDTLTKLHEQWFPAKPLAMHSPLTLRNSILQALLPPPAETPDAVARVASQLAVVGADCPYDTWRNVVWSVLSSGWNCAPDIALAWSQSAPNRFEQSAFDNLVKSFRADRGISLGTLDHHARANGWQPLVPTAPAGQLRDTNPTRPRLLTARDLQALPRMPWRIRGLLPAQGLASLYGPSGAGKSFLALDLAGAIASAQPFWSGAKVKSASVLYLALEGQGGIRQRVGAWELHHKSQAPDALRFILDDFTLLDSTEADDLAANIVATLGPSAVVVIDTLAQASPGFDENSGSDMSRIIANAKRLADAVSGLVLLVHHAGKDQSRGMRGHSSLFAAMDAVIEVANTVNGRTWRVAKSKDGISGGVHGFELVPYVVEQDEDGADITSCAVRQVLLTGATTTRKIVGKNQKSAFAVLTGLVSTYPDGIPIKDAIKAVGAAIQCEDARRTTRATEALAGLAESGHLFQDEGVIVLR